MANSVADEGGEWLVVAKPGEQGKGLLMNHILGPAAEVQLSITGNGSAENIAKGKEVSEAHLK